MYAIGECAAVDGRVYGIVAPGYAMAEIVAAQLTGGSGEFPEPDTSTKLKLMGVDVASFGDAHARPEGALEVAVNDAVAGTYKKLVVTDDGKTLLGGVLVGDATEYNTLRALVGRPLPAEPGAILAPAGGGAAVGVDALPDAAQICSCNAVSKGAITRAIHEDGCDSVGKLKACTRAGTACGSCVPMLGKLLSAAGVEQSKALVRALPAVARGAVRDRPGHPRSRRSAS